MKTCQQCKFQFHLTSQRFLCDCQQSQPVCSTCRRKVCKICLKPRTKQIIIPKCNKCFTRLYENDLLLQYNCQRYYCSKCLSQIFRQAYIKVAVRKLYHSQSNELFVKMYCGHQFPYDQLTQFFQHFCLSCGRQYDSILDYELNDGVKLCFFCFRQFEKTFQSLFIKCEFCSTVIKNSSQASILQNSDLAICHHCTLQSKTQQKIISQSRTKPVETQLKKKEQIKQANDFKTLLKQEQQKCKQPFIKKQQASSSIPKSPLSKLFKKPSIFELKQKQQKRSTNNNKSTSVSITSRFSNNFQQIDPQITQSLGLTQKVKLKKHLSHQTYVQQFPIDIQSNITKNSVKCKKCSSLIQQKVAYNLYNQTEDLSNKITSLSLLDTKYGSQISKQNTYYLCRICYFKSSERQKSILNTTASRIKSTTSSRPSKIQETTSKIDYLKPGKSSRRQMRSPSPSPNKQYSLTGSKQSSNIIENKGLKMDQFSGRKASLLQHQKSSSKKMAQTQKQSSRVSRQTQQNISQKSIPQRFMRCQLCRNMKKSLIATINQGYLCDDCYYKKSPHYDLFNKR